MRACVHQHLLRNFYAMTQMKTRRPYHSRLLQCHWHDESAMTKSLKRLSLESFFA